MDGTPSASGGSASSFDRNPGRARVAAGDRVAIEAEQVDVVELEALDLLGLGQHDVPGGRGRRIVGVELTRVGDRGQVADEVAHGPPGLPLRPLGGELGQGATGSAVARRPRGWRRTVDGAATRCARSDAARRRPPESPRAPSPPHAGASGRPGSDREPRAAAGGSRGRPRAPRSCRACVAGRSPCTAPDRSSEARRAAGSRPGPTAAESVGSASIRSQARTSRTSGRWNRAASPAKRNGTRRSSSAAATRRASRHPEPTITQTASGRTSPAASRCSISRAAAWASARSSLQRQNLTRASSESSPVSSSPAPVGSP